jgi:uncharacterized protein YceH (UPF0502 family)
LIEKSRHARQLSLSLNALVAAYQTSNRDPIMSLDDRAVLRSLDDFAAVACPRLHGSDCVTKYQHLVRGRSVSTTPGSR